MTRPMCLMCRVQLHLDVQTETVSNAHRLKSPVYIALQYYIPNHFVRLKKVTLDINANH